MEHQRITPAHRLRRFSAYAAMFVVVMIVNGCDRARSEADAVFDTLDAETIPIAVNASTLASYRFTLEVEPQVVALLRLGIVSAEAAEARLSLGPGQISDQTAAVSAYLMERYYYTDGIAALENYLKADPGNSEHFHGPEFAVHTLLILKGLPDPTGGLKQYDEATIQEAIWGP